MQAVVKLLPSTALAQVFHGALGGGTVPASALVVLAVWAVAAPVAAARWFRWE
jgi:ABC-2 type transport system permease protein